MPAVLSAGEDEVRALAERFDMTGGYIRNSVLRAAVLAAAAGKEMSMSDVRKAAALEYAELGKVSTLE